MENDGPRKRYCCKKGCLIRGRVFATNKKSNLDNHEQTEKHLGIKRDLDIPIPCSHRHEGCTYSTHDSSDLHKHELTHEKETKLGRPLKSKSVDDVLQNSWRLLGTLKVCSECDYSEFHRHKNEDLKTGDLQWAQDHLSEILQSNPTNIKIYLCLSEALDMKGDRGGAVAVLREAMSIYQPQLKFEYFDLALKSIKLGELDIAETIFRSLLIFDAFVKKIFLTNPHGAAAGWFDQQ